MVSCRSADSVGAQSGTNFEVFGTTFGQSGSSRDPVGHQFSNFSHRFWTCREAAKITLKRAPNQKCSFLPLWCFRTAGPDCSRLGPDWIPIGSRLDPDWIPTGSRRDPDWPKVVPKNAKLARDWMPGRSRFALFEKKCFLAPIIKK